MRLNLRYDPQYDFYQLIGVEMSADTETIQRAYRQKAKEVHPDRNPDRMEWATEQFQRLTEAYAILSDTELRRQYNALRWAYFSRANFAKTLPSSTVRSRPTHNPPRHYTTRPGYKPIQKRGGWLEESGMGWLRPFYVGAFELMNGPYRYIIPLLGLILLLNGMLIFGGFFSSSSDSPLDEKLATANGPTSTLSNITGGFISPPTPAPSVTPMVIPANCSPYAVIEFPTDGAQLTADTVQLIGTIEHPELYTYQVEVEQLGDSPNNMAQVTISLYRQPQILPERPIYHNQLVSLSPLLRFPAGYYRIILTIVHQNGSPLATCTITLQKQ